MDPRSHAVHDLPVVGAGRQTGIDPPSLVGVSAGVAAALGVILEVAGDAMRAVSDASKAGVEVVRVLERHGRVLPGTSERLHANANPNVITVSRDFDPALTRVAMISHLEKRFEILHDIAAKSIFLLETVPSFDYLIEV